VVRTPPHFRVWVGGGVTLSWRDEQLVRRGSSQRRTDGRQQAHGIAPPVRSASTRHRLAYSAPSLSRSRCLNMHTATLNMERFKFSTYSKVGNATLYLHVLKACKDSTRIRPVIHNPGTTRRFAFSRTFRLFYPRGEERSIGSSLLHSRSSSG
jgi:hypothetical protein